MVIANLNKPTSLTHQESAAVPFSGFFGKMHGLIQAVKLSVRRCAFTPDTGSAENSSDHVFFSTTLTRQNKVRFTLTPRVGFFPEFEHKMTPKPPSKSPAQDKLSLLQEIASTMVLTGDVSTIANLMIDLATTHTLAEKGSFLLLNACEELYIIASRGLDPELARTYRSSLGQGIVGKVAMLKQAVLVEDIALDDRFKDTHRDRYRTSSFISCPIMVRDQLLGVININDRKDGQPFSEDDFTLIKILANQAATAIRNAQLASEIKIKALELEELNHKLMNSGLAKAEFLTQISHGLRSPLNSMKGALYCLRQADTLPHGDSSEFLNILDIETLKIVDIVEDQLEYLRLEEERILIKPSIIDLRELIGGVISSATLQDSLERREIRLKVSFPKTLPHIAGDKVLVKLMMIHLLEGVTFPLRKNATVELTISEDEFVVVNLKVSQRFPDRITSQLFNTQAFSQTDLSNNALKLILARKSAENHGWTMTAQNTDHGFEVQLLIPMDPHRKMDVALSSAMNLYLDFVAELLNFNTCSVMLPDEKTGDLIIRSAKGIEESVIQNTHIRIGDRIAGWVALEGKPLLIEDIEKDERFPCRVGSNSYNTKSLLSLPLKKGNQTIGVLNLNNKKTANSFNQRDLILVSMIAERISHLIETLQQKDFLDEDYKQLSSSLDTLLSVGRIYQKRNPEIVDTVEKISICMGFDESLKNDAVYSSLIYDLGLMLVSEGVLRKKNTLSNSETSTIKVHPHTTVDLLSKIEFSERIKKSILHHHENWDGSGYPNGLKGNQIPVISRVLAVVDAYFSMIEPRPYRPRRSPQEALDQIHIESGSKFDPAVVTAMEESLTG